MPRRRVLAVAVSGLMGVAGAFWVVVAVIGLGALESVPEQGGCYPPQVPYGVALLVLAGTGLLTAAWTLRQSARVARGRAADGRYGLGLVITLALIAAFVVIAVPLNPDSNFEFGPC